jgi:hypothetical protein
LKCPTLHNKKFCCLLFFAVVSLPLCVEAQNPEGGRDLTAYELAPRVSALRLAPGEEIALDGRLNETAWERAVPATDFRQEDPDNGAPATERTEVRFLFSENSLFMGVTCFDSEPEALMGNSMQRDGSLSADDRFMWTFDPNLDGISGYSFEVNPSGAMGDGTLLMGANTGSTEQAWDGIWDARVEKTGIGWTIEIEIPFRTLNFDPTAPAWGVNFQRTVRRKNEESLWTGYARNQGLLRMINAGLLEGITEVSQGVGLDVQPYVVGNYSASPGRGVDSTYTGDAGVDLVYSITPQLKANFTINTDFAQTEVDQRQVNLTRFRLFFPERRDFFLEGNNFFDFGREFGPVVVPFFSRRIGLTDGRPQRINYGAKITGQLGSNDIGLLQVSTAAEADRVGEDFSVVRGKRRFLRQSFVGMMYTRRAEREGGATGPDSVAPDRHTMGVDFFLATSQFRGSQNLSLNGYYVWTTGLGPTERAMYGIRMDYPNDLFQLRLPFREIQANYDPAVGFVARRNIRRYNPELNITPRPRDSSVIRRFNFRIDTEFITDTQNRLASRDLQVIPFGVDFQSGDTIVTNIHRMYERLERDFEISDGVTLPGGGQYSFTRYRVQLRTANQRVLSLSTAFEDGDFFSGSRRDFSLDLGIRPRPGLLINIENEWNRVELPEGQFSTRVHRLNANAQFGPRLSVVNNVQYDSVSGVLGWQFRSRWIVRPGNDIYFVYAQNWIDDVDGRRMALDRSAATKMVYTHRF